MRSHHACPYGLGVLVDSRRPSPERESTARLPLAVPICRLARAVEQGSPDPLRRAPPARRRDPRDRSRAGGGGARRRGRGRPSPLRPHRRRPAGTQRGCLLRTSGGRVPPPCRGVLVRRFRRVPPARRASGRRRRGAAPLARQQVGVDDLGEQGVAEAIGAGRVVDLQHVAGDGLADRFDEIAFRQVRDGGEEFLIGPRAGHCDSAENALGRIDSLATRPMRMSRSERGHRRPDPGRHRRCRPGSRRSPRRRTDCPPTRAWICSTTPRAGRRPRIAASCSRCSARSSGRRSRRSTKGSGDLGQLARAAGRRARHPRSGTSPTTRPGPGRGFGRGSRGDRGSPDRSSAGPRARARAAGRCSGDRARARVSSNRRAWSLGLRPPAMALGRAPPAGGRPSPAA